MGKVGKIAKAPLGSKKKVRKEKSEKTKVSKTKKAAPATKVHATTSKQSESRGSMRESFHPRRRMASDSQKKGQKPLKWLERNNICALCS